LEKIMKEQFIVRQGDVLIVQAKETQGAEIPERNGRVVLAYGEVTGHAHAFYEQGASLFEGAPQKTPHLRLVEMRALKHEEHSPIDIPPGIYDLPMQTEWSDDLEPRRVAD
jgi:hypothetical protein